MSQVAAPGQRSAVEASRVGLRVPSLALLDAYADAMRARWSPNNSRDVTGEYLARIEQDPGEFIAWLLRPGEMIRLADGAEVQRLPDRLRWIVALDQPGEPLIGTIGLRWQDGTAELPEHVLGHVGYTLLPVHRGRGYATEALALILDEARDVGLSQVEIVCDHDNHLSRRVIEKNGGVLTETFVNPRYGDEPHLRFVIGLE